MNRTISLKWCIEGIRFLTLVWVLLSNHGNAGALALAPSPTLGEQPLETTETLPSHKPNPQLERRLKFAVLAGSAVLGVVGVLFVFLRIDHITRGFYRRRLQTLGAFSMFVILLIVYLIYIQISID